MEFWSKTSAAPSLWMASGLSSLAPRFLRTETPTKPPQIWKEYSIVRLRGDDTARVNLFWTQHYRGDDWRFVQNNADSYTNDSRVILLGLVCKDTIVATIVSTPFCRGKTFMSHGAYVDARVIEGLCVHSDLRGTGVAGFMIHNIDYHTTIIYGPTVLFWSRELNRKPLFTTAIQTATYGYISCTATVGNTEYSRMDWSEFHTLWVSNSPDWVSSCAPCIVATTPENRRGNISVFKRSSGLPCEIVVVANTGRVTIEGAQAIYEILWCGFLDFGKLVPFKTGHSFHKACTAIAGLLGTGLLFGSSVPSGGAIDASWTGWRFNTSGVHSWFIYNYIPPVFGSCALYAVRDEL